MSRNTIDYAASLPVGELAETCRPVMIQVSRFWPDRQNRISALVAGLALVLVRYGVTNAQRRSGRIDHVDIDLLARRRVGRLGARRVPDIRKRGPTIFLVDQEPCLHLVPVCLGRAHVRREGKGFYQHGTDRKAEDIRIRVDCLLPPGTKTKRCFTAWSEKSGFTRSYAKTRFAGVWAARSVNNPYSDSVWAGVSLRIVSRDGAAV